MKPQMLVLMGGQGVGKGTFSKMLQEIHNYDHIETGAILRALPKDSEIGKLIAGGNLIPDEKIMELVQSTIKPNQDVILDGFPRTTAQAQWLVKQYSEKFDIHVLYLDVPQEIMVQRIQKRIREGGGRADDANEEAIKKRLSTFWNTTVPAIDWLRTANGIKFSDVDVTGEVNQNFAEIKKALNI